MHEQVDRSVDWWRDKAHLWGVQAMEHALREGDEWAQLVDDGKRELARCVRVTGLELRAGDRVIDVGCGAGRMTYALAERAAFVLGVDVSDALLEQARQLGARDNVRFERVDGSRIRVIEPGPWTLAFSYEVFHYVGLPTLSQYFQDIAGLLSPGGRFVFEVNTAPFRAATRVSGLVRRGLHACGKQSWRGFPTDPGFQRKPHTVGALRAVLGHAGFTVRSVHDEAPSQTWFVAEKGSLKGIEG